MMIDLKRAGLAAVISVGLGIGIADAQCPLVSAAQGKSISTAIFTGEATTITNLHFSQIVTFNVERVWQGMVGKELTAYQTVSSEEPRFVVGMRYLVFAHPRDLSSGLFDLSLPGIGPDARLKIDEDKQSLAQIDLGMIGCLSGPADALLGQHLIGELGPSHSPE